MTQQAEQLAKRSRASVGIRENLRNDLPAGLVVFFVALPLCLGIAFASGAPVIAGLITGIVGGLVVALISKSALSVSGPAAGLFVIVYDGIQDLGYETFLLAGVVAGVFQIVLGFLRAGIIAYYFPVSVIKGMLAGIGILLLLKQIPHGFGYNKDFEGDVFFGDFGGENTFTAIQYAASHLDLFSTLITVVGLFILILWQRVPALQRMRYLPGPLVVVIMGIVANMVATASSPDFALGKDLLVAVPEFKDFSAFIGEMKTPDFSGLGNPQVYWIALILAGVASIETLLCVEAIDKLDPLKRRTPTSHELKAQGIGNIVASVLGGIPMTAVIVRGSANVHSGGRTPMSAFFHGFLLLISVVTIPQFLNQIPLAALAAILLHIGYKLAPVGLFKKMAKDGTTQFVPFIITILGIVFTNLLLGVAIGLAVGIFFVLRAHISAPYFLHQISTVEKDGNQHTRMELAENVSFLNKAALSESLQAFPDGSHIEIDATNNRHIDHDALDVIQEFIDSTTFRNIKVTLRGLEEQLQVPEANKATG